MIKTKRFAITGGNMGATIKDVARLSGLSIATISKYINGGNVLEKNRIKIEQAISQLDFKVNEIARGLKTNRTMTIGVLIPDLKNIFGATIISNIEDILTRYGYSMMVCNYKQGHRQEREKLEFLEKKMVDGIIIIPTGSNSQYIGKLINDEVPVISIDRPIPDVDCDTVMVDNQNATYNAVEQLIVRGHRRIGVICGPEGNYTADERLKGYLRVYEDYSLKVDPAMIKRGYYDVESGYNLLNELLDHENPVTAVLATNYEMTLGAIMAINERNIDVPGDLSFIGFDNLQMAKIVKPALTIVVQPMQQICENAANLLLKRLNKDMSNFPSIVRLKTELVIGGSIREVAY